jgi:ABC-type nitrate/sulfonate/bicarbonate transport system substrate-binding protein
VANRRFRSCEQSSIKLRMTRRQFFYGAFSCLTLAAQSPGSGAVVTISHAGLVGGGGDALLVPIAAKQNFFLKHGISANLVRGSLEQGQIGVFGSPAVLQGLGRGLDLKIVAAFSSGRTSSRLVARPTIRSARDLRGKVLGANGVGAGSWTMTILALERLGLDQRRDEITIRSTGDQVATAKALKEGAIDAALLASGPSQELLSQGYPLLLDLSTVEVYGPQLVLATTGQFLRDHGAIVSGALSALIESAAFMSAPVNKGTYQAEFAQAFGITTPAGIERGYQDLKNLNRRPFPSRECLVEIQRLMSLNQPEIGRLDLDGVIQDGIVRELDRRGDIAALYEKYGVAL